MSSLFTFLVFVMFAAARAPATAGAKGANAQSIAAPVSVISLDASASGRRVSAKVGERIELSLYGVGPRQYDTPQVSSPAVRFDGVAQKWPPPPGGGERVFMFEAECLGEAEILIPNTFKNASFAATIDVGAPGAIHRTPADSIKLDQANTATRSSSWTNVVNDVRQTFTPTLPRLTAVEVGLIVSNPDESDDTVTLAISQPDGTVLQWQVSKPVSVADSAQALFQFPRGGVEVTPGEKYAIRVMGGARFGWKYVEGGYSKGEALFNGKPIISGGRSSFLFRAYGED